MPAALQSGTMLNAGFEQQHQRVLLALMLTQPKFAITNISAINPNHFDLEPHRRICAWIFDHVRANKGTIPSREYLEFQITDSIKQNLEMRHAIMVELDACYRTDMYGAEDVKVRYLEWCRKRRIEEVLYKSLQDTQMGRPVNIGELSRDLAEADSFIHSQADMGVRLFSDLDHTKWAVGGYFDRRPLPTGDHQFDSNLAGGPGIGEMLLYIAPPKTGKTTRMLHDARNYARQGLPGVFITGEQEAEFLARRFVEAATGHHHSVFKDDDNAQNAWALHLSQHHAPVFVKRMNRFSPMDVLRYVERCNAEAGMVMRWVVVDYLNLMLKGGKQELRHELAALCRELRSVFVDLDVVGITATQTNKESSKKELINAKDISECWELIGIADVIVGIASPEDLSKKRIMNLYGSASRIDGGFWKLSYRTELELARIYAMETGVKQAPNPYDFTKPLGLSNGV